MRLPRPFRKGSVAIAFGALLATGVGLFLYEFPIGRSLKYASYDLLHMMQGDLRVSEAVLVYMDEPSYRELKQPLNAPWDRSLHAQLVRRLTAAGARAIVFDIVFSDPSPNSAGDAEFAVALTNSGRVILACDNVPTTPDSWEIIPPIDLLRDAAAAIGSAETLPDSDLTIRTHTPEKQLPALSWAAADFLGAEATKDSAIRHRWLHYYGRPDTLPGQSYFRALNTNAVADSFFRGKTAFVGARLFTKFANERKDEFRNPYSGFLGGREESERPFVSGVAVQATAFLNLVRDDWLRASSPAWGRIVLALFGIAIGGGLVALRPTVASIAAGLAAVVIIMASFLFFRRYLVWFPWLILAIQTGTALSWSVLFNSIQLYVQKRLYEQTLARYLSPKLVRKFSKEPTILDRPAQKQTVTLFFSDIADFTSLSEGVDSDDLSRLMNQYFETAVTQCIHRCDGTVVKYIGDAIFAFWNAPEEQTDHALRASEAALRFRDASFIWIDGQRIRTRIGVHTGLANVGNFGSVDRYDYTALGENVNLASRIEGLNKYLGTNFLISRSTCEGLTGQLPTRDLGSFRLKGFEKPVQVFELIGWPSELPSTRPWADTFAEALALFRKRNLEKAGALFRHTLELRPDDGPSIFYLKRIEHIIAEPTSGEWTGDIELSEK